MLAHKKKPLTDYNLTYLLLAEFPGCSFFFFRDPHELACSIKMKFLGFDVQALYKPLDVLAEIAATTIDEEPLYLCDLTDIVRKHVNWTTLLPRVAPFYGKGI